MDCGVANPVNFRVRSVNFWRFVMYAIVRSGGEAIQKFLGDVIRVEKLDNALGSEFNMTEVLAIGGETTVTGQPVVKMHL